MVKKLLKIKLNTNIGRKITQKQIIVYIGHYLTKFELLRKLLCIDEGVNSLIYILRGGFFPRQYIALYAKVRILFQFFKNET